MMAMIAKVSIKNKSRRGNLIGSAGWEWDREGIGLENSLASQGPFNVTLLETGVGWNWWILTSTIHMTNIRINKKIKILHSRITDRGKINEYYSHY